MISLESRAGSLGSGVKNPGSRVGSLESEVGNDDFLIERITGSISASDSIFLELCLSICLYALLY